MAKVEEDRVRRIEELVGRLNAIADVENRETARALVEAIVELHGAGLERMMDIVFDTGDSGKAAIRRFAGDELISSLLLLHNLHPDTLETRVLRAIAKTHGDAELVSVFDGVVRVRLSSGACGLKDSVKALIQDAAPDLGELVIEEATPSLSNDFVPLTSLGLAARRTA
jgi:Fe-S cluster biogenesis protein NfuA